MAHTGRPADAACPCDRPDGQQHHGDHPPTCRCWQLAAGNPRPCAAGPPTWPFHYAGTTTNLLPPTPAPTRHVSNDGYPRKCWLYVLLRGETVWWVAGSWHRTIICAVFVVFLSLACSGLVVCAFLRAWLLLCCCVHVRAGACCFGTHSRPCVCCRVCCTAGCFPLVFEVSRAPGEYGVCG